MKVLFMARWFPERGNYSGIFIKEHALAVSRFCEVAVIHGQGSRWQRERYKFYSSVEDGLKVLRFTYRKIPLFPDYSDYMKGFLLAFERLAAEGFEPDIINAGIYTTGVAANNIKQKYGIPYVIREGYSGFMRKNMSRKKLKRAKIGMENANFILPVSGAQKKAILAYGIKGDFEVVPNAVPDYFLYNPEMKKTAGIKRSLCVAAMHPKKNYPTLINACKIIHNIRRDWQLDIVGEGEKMDEYKKMVSCLSLEGHIHFLGGRQKTEIAEMMQSSDFFVLPSKFEPSGNVLVESLCSGLPVVATNVGGIPEIINESNGILVDPDSPEKLADAMLFMMDNSDKYDREKLSRDAKSKYSYDVIGKQITDIYKSIK